MITNKRWILTIGLALIVLGGLALAGCTVTATQAVPTASPPTPTPQPPVATATPAAATPTTAPPTPTPTETGTKSRFVPLDEGECGELAEALSLALGLPHAMALAPFGDMSSGETGTSCQVTITGTGQDFENIGLVDSSAREMLVQQGWQEDLQYGAGGPGATIWGFRKANKLCQLLISSQPTEADLCAEDEPFVVCWERLTPEQQQYDVALDCVLDTVGLLPLPSVIPPEFELTMQALVLSGVPPVLPPAFPVGDGQPAIVPYIHTVGDGVYELSLDYGADCQGAGACHYGVLAGNKVDGDTPVGTSNIPFRADKVLQVSLANGIEGFFIESECGANCSDALVFWIQGSYQYVLGIKAGKQADVLDLANAAIANSSP